MAKFKYTEIDGLLYPNIKIDGKTKLDDYREYALNEQIEGFSTFLHCNISVCNNVFYLGILKFAYGET